MKKEKDVKKHKHFAFALLVYAIAYVLGLFAYDVVRELTVAIHGYLHLLLPKLIPLYNAILSPEEYSTQASVISAVALVFTFYILNFASLRLDNGKNEFIISKTEGFYTLREGCELYCKSFLISDTVVTLLVPLIFNIPIFFVLEEWFRYGADIPIWAARVLAPITGNLSAIAFTMIISFVTRLLCIRGAVKHYRAAWLAGFA